MLDVFTNEKFADDRQAYGAGFAEGLLTARHIYTTVVNLEDATFGHRSGGAKGRSSLVRKPAIQELHIVVGDADWSECIWGDELTHLWI